MTPLPKTRAEQIVLRDRLNAMIDNPGADDAPIQCDVVSHDTISAYRSDVFPGTIAVVLRRDGDRSLCVRLDPEKTRRLAARILYLADNPEGE